MARAVLTILAKDLRLRARDRSAFVIGVLAPLVLATILSQVVGGITGENFDAELAIVDEDGGAVGGVVARELRALSDGITVRSGLTADEAREQVADGDVDAAVVIPAGFVAGMVPGAEQQPLRVIGHPDLDISRAIARGVADSVAANAEAGRLAVVVAAALADDGSVAIDPESFDPESFDAGSFDSPSGPAVQVVTATADERQLDRTTYLMAGLGALFVFFLVQYGVVGLLEERRDGTLARLLAAPIPPLAIPLAKAATSLVLGLVGLTVLAVVSTLALGADWGDPLAAAALIVALVLAAVSIVGIICAAARTAEQANTAQSVVALILGLVGGSFFPVAQGEGIVTDLAVATPHHWFLRGLGDAQVGGLAEVLPSVLALLTFAAVAGSVGVLLLRRGAWR